MNPSDAGTIMSKDDNVGVGVCAIVTRPTPYANALNDPQFLLIHRCGAPPAEGADTWSVPGGWLEHGETLAEAAARETFEEVGLKAVEVVSGHRHAVVTHRSETTGLWCVTVFVGLYALSDEPVLNEPDKVDEARWVTVGEFRRDYASTGELFRPLQIAADQGKVL